MARWIALSKKIEDDRGVRHDPRPLPPRGDEDAVGQTAHLQRRVLQRRPPDEEEQAVIRWVDLAINGVIYLLAGWIAVESGSMVPLVLGVMFIIGRAVKQRRGDAAWQKDRASLADAPAVCPVCSYPLQGSPTEPDGCTVCPECGAAWRFPIA